MRLYSDDEMIEIENKIDLVLSLALRVATDEESEAIAYAQGMLEDRVNQLREATNSW